MALPATTLTQADIKRIESLYAVADRDEVFGFLDQHPLLIAILIEASEVIPSYFPREHTLALDLSVDPEDPEDRVLFAFIRTPLHADEALTHLDRLDREWWLDAASQARGELVLDVERV